MILKLIRSSRDTVQHFMIGKYGLNYPIDSSTYRCSYVQMKVNSTRPDYTYIYWFLTTFTLPVILGTRNPRLLTQNAWNLLQWKSGY